MEEILRLERVGRDNFDEYVGLIGKLAEYENLDPPDRAAKARLRRDCLKTRPEFFAYIARIGDRAVGYLAMFYTYSTFLGLKTLFLEDLFLLEEYRRHGFGREMFAFCVRQAKKRGCGRLEWAVLDWNKPAHQFFTKLGGIRLGWQHYRLDRERIENFSDR
ncbi:GNAT family N-acetyltransferase [candidate division KSB1 bacterium]